MPINTRRRPLMTRSISTHAIPRTDIPNPAFSANLFLVLQFLVVHFGTAFPGNTDRAFLEPFCIVSTPRRDIRLIAHTYLVYWKSGLYNRKILRHLVNVNTSERPSLCASTSRCSTLIQNIERCQARSFHYQVQMCCSRTDLLVYKSATYVSK